MVEIGDYVEFEINQIKTKGCLMPSNDDKIMMIKLDNGYNVGYKKKDVKKIKILTKKKKSSKTKIKIEQNKKLKKVTLLHCGGTIASKVDYQTGGVKAKFTPEELLELFPELTKMANFNVKMVSNLLSENTNFDYYNKLILEIKKELDKTEGIIITHGTDTLHYTSAALSLAFAGVQIPIILIGAQKSSDRGSSDSFLNLKMATKFAVESGFKGVAVCMHNSINDDACAIIDGLRVRKMHSSRRDAFKAINCSPYALVSEKEIQFLTNLNSEQELKIGTFNSKLKIGLIKSRPNMLSEEISFYKNYDGLVLEGTGLGHFPEYVLTEIEKLAKKIPVVMSTQTIHGVVNMNVYSTGRELIKIGVLGNGNDLTPEATYIKLAYLLSNNLELNFNNKNIRKVINYEE